MARKRYPIGIQTFERIRKEDWFYVDKTEYIYRMTHTDGTYFFLSRPRRFGKSLLVSTFESYFEGKKELFNGLAIEKLEKEWNEYPVLHFSLAGGKHMEKEQLEHYLLFILKTNEEKFGITCDSPAPNIRMLNLIQTVYEKTGKQPVVLIDEYDAPLLDVVHEGTSLDILRNVMRNFYSPLKDCEKMLRFVFLTGITKFSQLSIFSELNNIQNALRKLLPHQFHNPVAILRRDNTDLCSLLLQSEQCISHFRKQKRIYSHIQIGFLHILLPVSFQHRSIRNASQNRERILQRLSDRTLDGEILYPFIPMTLQHIPETFHDSPGRIHKRIVKIKQISFILFHYSNTQSFIRITPSAGNSWPIPLHWSPYTKKAGHVRSASSLPLLYQTKPDDVRP